MERARQIRQQLGDSVAGDFKAKSASVDNITVDEWKIRLPLIIDQYNPNDIYNADETGLFFKALPDRSLVIAKEKCKGGKKSKERFTILLCTNMTGTDKLKPLVIGKFPIAIESVLLTCILTFVAGKAAKPRCFKNLNVTELPVKWRSNSSSWMTASLFDDWLKSVNKTMMSQKRKILLFIDHASCHNPESQYSNVTVKFFPVNTTSKLQPLDQGIIKNFKCYYRQYLVKHIICRCAVAKSCEDIVITVLDAVHWTNNAWKAVNQSTICNAFQTSGFKCSIIQPTVNVMTDISTLLDQQCDADDVPSALQTLDMLLAHVKIGEERLSASEFVEMDSEIPVFNEGNDPLDKQVNIDETFRNQIISQNNDDINIIGEEDDVPAETPPKLVEAMEMVRRLHLLAAMEQPQLHHVISQLDSQLTQLFIESQGLKQTTIEDFFHKK
ncbi:unnamed protein product [Rotaria sp. Silwood2]|nr:unnamed protein product [Rotaria sp. Silwood2]CAF2962034.1 unnamed protein product [Rotaria sp. Silwood2]CAF3154680.1 unnamed protein product [Rotaria sp. Silwood2]CAF3304918.1 unnamed protein product [Rotaria sp. Silwood2]CAF4200903.1 unnamed protein product [Rotaria sp. Silwood2]